MELKKPSTFSEINSFAKNGELSFKEKVSLLYEERRKEPVDSAKNFNKYTPIVFFVELYVLWYLGITLYLPYIYGNFDVWVLRAMQVFECFLLVEITVNWLCMHHIDSTYNPIVHGTKPASFVGPIITDQSLIYSDVHMITENTGEGQQQQTNMRAKLHTPYWMWGFCKLCDKPRPPRCHHCTLCERCVLKRDHHCYFSRRCIGFNNLRYFTIFLVYATFSAVFNILHLFPFFLSAIQTSGYLDFIPVLPVIKFILFIGEFRMVVINIAFWILVMLVVYSSSVSIENWKWILKGKTSFEINNEHKLKLTNTMGLNQKLRAVFGSYWMLNFLVPTHRLFEPEDDPVTWPTIEVN